MMRIISNFQNFSNRVNETAEEMPVDAHAQVALVGAAVVVYLATSLTYFGYKGTKLVVKAIQNHH